VSRPNTKVRPGDVCGRCRNVFVGRIIFSMTPEAGDYYRPHTIMLRRAPKALSTAERSMHDLSLFLVIIIIITMFWWLMFIFSY